jgi:ribosomal protein S18 acetylase RimI-like enzyme
MLREFRPRDADALLANYREEFPEDQYLETNLEEMGRLLRRSFGPGPRFLLRMARAFGRPILRFFVVEEDGGMVGTAFLSYLSHAGYVALVQVLPTYRRRGIATQLLEACTNALRAARREYVVLEVLESNTAARSLYARLGFRELESREVLSRETTGNSTPHPVTQGLRPLDRNDGAALAAIAASRLSPEHTRVLPPEPKQFYVRPMVAQALASDTMAWVAIENGKPVGFVRATVSRIMGAAHMTAPLVSPSLSPERARSLVDQAIVWDEERQPRRILCEIPMTDDGARALLVAAGFRPAYKILTLYRAVAA